ncbi:bacteriocin immunity protein [Streptomyces sp. SID7909]|uniref:bacteriocin immunity protein n=1 Tax=Streptomyces sp. SID7909 TaxID=2706092 RepID=UPI0013B5FC57|nr:bacteriocin immunity protein [Streptomyces sp. SID7909]NEC09607.1 e9imm peptide [Streptomyces sp. SID7909]
MTRETAITLVQKIMDVEYDEEETAEVLDRLDSALACPTGYISDLIFWPKDRQESTAAEVVDRALAYRPFAL